MNPVENTTTTGNSQEIRFPVSLRDWFAGHALIGYLSALTDQSEWREYGQPEDAARTAFTYADAMIQARKEGA